MVLVDNLRVYFVMILCLLVNGWKKNHKRNTFRWEFDMALEVLALNLIDLDCMRTNKAFSDGGASPRLSSFGGCWGSWGRKGAGRAGSS